MAWVDGSECAVLPQDLYKLEEVRTVGGLKSASAPFGTFLSGTQ